jgi:hypothetical protein
MTPIPASALTETVGAPTPSMVRKLRDIAGRDTNVVVFSVIVANVLRALSSVVLTRLLAPEVFGISGVIASIIFAFGMVSDLGFQAFVVRHPDGDNPRFLDTIWTMAVLRSVILTCAAFALAPTMAHLFGKPGTDSTDRGGSVHISDRWHGIAYAADRVATPAGSTAIAPRTCGAYSADIALVYPRLCVAKLLGHSGEHACGQRV